MGVRTLFKARWSIVLVATTAAVACSEERAEGTTEDGTPVGVTPAASALPPLVLRDDTKDLLLTWVDDAGDFHVVQKIADVPKEARSRVRVVVTTSADGTGDRVYVANLDDKKPDGAYAISAMARSAWDEIGASKRKARMEALAPSAKPPAPAASAMAVAGPVKATVYGADWCKPCHQAENFLKSMGVDVTKKDIEKSSAAAREMQGKLAKINRKGASIPVIDVMGRVMVGYNAQALRRAVESVRGREHL